MIDRRRFLAGWAASAAALPRGAPALDSPAVLRLEYEAASLPPVPPPLAAESPARIVVEFSSAGGRPECWLGARVRLDGERALLPLSVWTADGPSCWRAREGLWLPAFRGDFLLEGGRQSLSVSGREAFAARPGTAAGGPGPEAPALPWLAYRAALAADWTQGPLADDPVELWSIRAAATSGWKALDPASCKASGDLDGWLPALGAGAPVAAGSLASREEAAARFELEIERHLFAPFAFRNHRGGLHGMPPNAAHATESDLDAYRNRRASRSDGLVLVAIDCFASSGAVEKLLPPPCVAAPNPILRVLALRGLNDSAADEAWLLAECSVEGARAWYAISHLRPSLSGAEYGREVLGYPTKSGAVTAQVGANRFSAAVSRKGQPLWEAWGSYGGFSTGTSLSQMTVAALRPCPGPTRGSTWGEVVQQRWYYQGLRRPVVRGSLQAAFPAAARDGGGELWNEIGPVQAFGAMVMDGAGMQRLPGKAVARLNAVGRYYQDRCDGNLPWEPPPAGGADTSD